MKKVYINITIAIAVLYATVAVVGFDTIAKYSYDETLDTVVSIIAILFIAGLYYKKYKEESI